MPHSSIVHDLRSAHSADALLTGVPLPTLLYFALPIILGNIFQQLYSIVDAIVVGNFLGDLPLSGISVASPIVDVANALVIGGTIVTGGFGYVLGSVIGALVRSTIDPLTSDFGVPAEWTTIVVGLMILIFVVLQRAVTAFNKKE